MKRFIFVLLLFVVGCTHREWPYNEIHDLNHREYLIQADILENKVEILYIEGKMSKQDYEKSLADIQKYREKVFESWKN